MLRSLLPPHNKIASIHASACNGTFIAQISLTCRLPIQGSLRNFFSKMGSQNKKVLRSPGIEDALRQTHAQFRALSLVI